jgi:hypothetical protein
MPSNHWNTEYMTRNFCPRQPEYQPTCIWPEMHMAVNVGSTMLWDMMPCSKAGKNEHLRRRYAVSLNLKSPHQSAFTFHCSCQLCDHHLIWHHELHYHSRTQFFFCFFSTKALYVWPVMTDAHSVLSKALVLLFYTHIPNSHSTSPIHLNCSLLSFPLPSDSPSSNLFEWSHHVVYWFKYSFIIYVIHKFRQQNYV